MYLCIDIAVSTILMLTTEIYWYLIVRDKRKHQGTFLYILELGHEWKVPTCSMSTA